MASPVRGPPGATARDGESCERSWRTADGSLTPLDSSPPPRGTRYGTMARNATSPSRGTRCAPGATARDGESSADSHIQTSWREADSSSGLASWKRRFATFHFILMICSDWVCDEGLSRKPLVGHELLLANMLSQSREKAVDEDEEEEIRGGSPFMKPPNIILGDDIASRSLRPSFLARPSGRESVDIFFISTTIGRVAFASSPTFLTRRIIIGFLSKPGS
eukprot:CAMPEP_0180245830 /NCGR_PEP_ID=MMETSP0987-20121128/35219_1 /TAXON_ID=697907 /ORGANISM="non described non described, Strain CCMP2293" /LENGTH=220 /DNA_ID=CAMNT_0022213543 /DNA_START=114 /DNA_END=773 /DNA_ORIENTATION=+